MTTQKTDHAALRRRIRLVTLIDRLDRGGAEHVAQSLASAFDPGRVDSTLAISRAAAAGRAAQAEREAIDSLDARGVRVLHLGRRSRFEVAGWRRLRRFLHENRTDVLHAHKFGSNVWASLLGHACGVPVVLAHEHSWGAGGSLPRRLLDRCLIAPRVDRLIAVSREDQRRMVDIERISRAKTLVLPNGVPAASPTTGRDVRAEFGIAPATLVVGTVASLTRVKAIDVLIHAASDLVPRHRDLKVLVVGDGPERRNLQDLIDRLGLGGAVTLVGPRSDVADVLTAVDIGVCCSDSEGSPLSVMEYMRGGIPVVATAVGGLPELIDHGVHGLLVPPRNAHDLAAALEQLLNDDEQRKAMGQQAQARQRAEYSLEMLVHKLENLYADLLACRVPAEWEPVAERVGACT